MILFKYLVLVFVVKSISSQMDDGEAQSFDVLDDPIEEVSVVSVPEAETETFFSLNQPAEVEEFIETPIEQVVAPVRARQNLGWSDLGQVRQVAVVKAPSVATVARAPSYQASRTVQVQTIKSAPVSVVARKGAVISRAQLNSYAQVAPSRQVAVVSKPKTVVVQAKPYQAATVRPITVRPVAPVTVKPYQTAPITVRPIRPITVRPIAPVTIKPYQAPVTVRPVRPITVRPVAPVKPYYGPGSTALPAPQPTEAPYYTTQRSTALPIPQPTEAYPSYPIRSPVSIKRRVVSTPVKTVRRVVVAQNAY